MRQKDLMSNCDDFFHQQSQASELM